MKKILKKTGSIALMSTLLISAIIILLVVGMSELTISGAYQSFNNISSKITYYAADTCLEETLFRLEIDPTFTGTAINIDTNTHCTISIEDNTITINANHLDFWQVYQGDFSITPNGEANNVRLLNWQELEI